MQETDALEQQSEDERDSGGVLDRARGVAGAAKQQISRSAEVLSGADIRKFDDFTDATTRAVVGVHRDQAELRELQTKLAEQIERTNQAVDSVRQRQAKLSERLEDLGQSVDGVLQGQGALSALVEESAHSHAPATLIIAVVASGVALR